MSPLLIDTCILIHKFQPHSRQNTLWLSRDNSPASEHASHRNWPHSRDAVQGDWNAPAQDLLAEGLETCRYDKSPILIN